MCTPALMDLRTAYPHAHITLWARPAIAELMRHHPSLNDVLIYDKQREHSGIFGKIRFTQQLRSQGFQVAILLQNAFEAALLAFLAGITDRWGYATDGRSLLLTKAIPISGTKKSHHQVRYYQSLINNLVGLSEPRPLNLVVLGDEEIALNGRFPDLFAEEHDYLVGINPGSVYGSAKRWPSERFAELADLVMTELQQKIPEGRTVRCVVVGGRGEEILGNQIATMIKGKAIVLSGKTTLRELMVIIKRCHLFLTNDTGPMHIGAAFGIPLVSIFGSTDPAYTAPLTQEQNVVQHSVRCSPCFLRSCPIDHRCMTNISVSQAYQVAIAQIPEMMKYESCP